MKNTRILTYSLAAAMGLTLALPSVQAAENNPQRRDTIGRPAATSPRYDRGLNRAATPIGGVERADRLIGMNVHGSDGQKIADIKDIVVDLESGRVLYLVLDAGSKDIAVPSEMFASMRGNNATLNIDKAKLESGPEFTSDRKGRENLSQASFVNQVYTHFGQSPWWQGSVPADQGKFNNVHLASSLPNVSVKNVSSQDIGEIRNTMIDLNSGRVLFVVMVPDRDLDLGENYFALPPSAFTLGSDQKHLVTDVTREKLAGAPKFGKNDWNTLSNTSFASRVYQYYGKQAYFDARQGDLRPTGREDTQVYPDQRSNTNRYWDSTRDSDRSWDRDNSSTDRDTRPGNRRGLWDINRDNNR